MPIPQEMPVVCMCLRGRRVDKKHIHKKEIKKKDNVTERALNQNQKLTGLI